MPEKTMYPQPAAQPVQKAEPVQQKPVQEGEYCIWAILGLIFAFVFPLLGLIFSIIALKKIKANSALKGHGLALAGLIVSIVFMILYLIMLPMLGAIAYFGVLSPSTFAPAPGFP